MKSIVILHAGKAVTTSLAIAGGTENEHASVILLVRKYLADLEEFGGVRFEIAPFETVGGTQTREVAILNEQQSTLLLTYMRNSEIVRQFKKALVKAFFELSQAATPVDPMQVLNDPAAMRGLLLGYTEKVIQLQDAVNSLAPKADALDRLATADGSFCIRDAAKTLQLQEKAFKQLLSELRWIYRRPMGSGWLAYSDKLQMGLMEHKVSSGEKGDGSEWIDTQARVTPKGMSRLAEIIEGRKQAA
ncbi:phage antirepressor KilAC domain-containing protein [Undibacterium sp.]|uniref:phage antirepressor KilAC domain-containing protein n=1 Tax=Undibacterium sp. TaxID=1914977 RepID=UPI00374D2314